MGLKIKNPEKSCNFRKEFKCCVWLTLGPNGFECEKNTGSSIEKTLIERWNAGETNAKGQGYWDNCEVKIKDDIFFRYSDLQERVLNIRKELQMAEDELNEFEEKNIEHLR